MEVWKKIILYNKVNVNFTYLNTNIMKKILLLLIVPLLSFTQSIQQQIDEADEGAILNINEGTYSEFISINKSITLNCNSNCIIDASGLETAIYIEASNVSIDGFEIIGNDLTTSGIIITPTCSNINISNNIIHGMSLPNQSNTSPLSYAILTYGSSENEFPTTVSNLKSKIDTKIIEKACAFKFIDVFK